jgi:hypothetical protein
MAQLIESKQPQNMTYGFAPSGSLDIEVAVQAGEFVEDVGTAEALSSLYRSWTRSGGLQEAVIMLPAA